MEKDSDAALTDLLAFYTRPRAAVVPRHLDRTITQRELADVVRDGDIGLFGENAERNINRMIRIHGLQRLANAVCEAASVPERYWDDLEAFGDLVQTRSLADRGRKGRNLRLTALAYRLRGRDRLEYQAERQAGRLC